MKKLLILLCFLTSIAYGQQTNSVNTKFPNGLQAPNGATPVPTSGLTAGALFFQTATGLRYYDGSAWQTLGIAGSGVTSVSGTANRITSSGGTTPVIDISSSYVGQNSITTLGTITTGTWNGTAIANANLANSTISGVSLGSSLNNITFNNSGSGDASATTYNGGTARTISYNTIGAAPASQLYWNRSASPIGGQQLAPTYKNDKLSYAFRDTLTTDDGSNYYHFQSLDTIKLSPTDRYNGTVHAVDAYLTSGEYSGTVWGNLTYARVSPLNTQNWVQNPTPGFLNHANLVAYAGVTMNVNGSTGNIGTASSFSAFSNWVGTGTLGHRYGLVVDDVLKGVSGGTIDNQYGVYLDNLATATRNYGFYSQTTSGSNRWNLFMKGNAANFLSGTLLVGDSVATAGAPILDVTGSIGSTNITASRAVVTDANSVLNESATTATELGYVSGVTSAIQTQLNTKAPLASPTFTGTVTIPTPFTLGATSVTSTGTQLNYLSSATGTTGTTSTNLVFSTSPTLVTPVLGAATATSVAATSFLRSPIFQVFDNSASQGGLYSYAKVTGSGSDYTPGIYSENTFWIATGGNTTKRFQIDGSGNATLTGALGINGGSDNVKSGTYTPTITGVTNYASGTAYPLQYMRVGTTVTVSGELAIQATGVGAVEFRINLPVSSNIGNTYNLGGAGVFDFTGNYPVGIKGDATNDAASFFYTTVGTGTYQLFFSYTYQII